MTVFYQNSPQIIITNKILEIINYLNEFVNGIKEKHGSKSKEKQAKYEKEVKEFIGIMEKTEDAIDNDPLFTDIELFDFVDIKEMTSYILKDPCLFKKHVDFIRDLFKDYYHILMFKYKSTRISYESEYKKFEYEFNRKREFFYTDIYEHMGIYDDTLDKVTNILWRDLN